MKNLWLLCASLFFCPLYLGSCDEDEDGLPPITMEGKNTFGCLVNGKVWHPEAPALGQLPVYADHTTSNFLTIGSTSETASFYFIVPSPINLYYAYSLQDTSIARAYYVDKRTSICIYEDYHVLDGEIVHSKFDLQNNIVSGTFKFTTYNSACGDTIRITDGRFDIGELTR